jgi:hypothetical protein
LILLLPTPMKIYTNHRSIILCLGERPEENEQYKPA